MPPTPHLRLAALLTLPALAEDPNPWPQKFQAPSAKVISTKASNDVAFAYETANFRLHSDKAIDPARLAKFATVIESVPLLLQAFPLPLWAPPKGEKPRIILYSDSLDYHSAGGPHGSTGYYDGRRQRVLIRADIFLNPPTAQPTRLLPKPNEDLLVHELTHLCMHDLLWRTSPWFFEGLAEYMAAAHTAGGAYDFTRIDSAIRDHVRRNLPPDEDHLILLPPLQEVLTTTSAQWIEGNKRAAGHAIYRPYAASLLLIHYHLHGTERRKAVDTYLQTALAHRDPRRPRPILDVGSTIDIQSRLTKFWEPRGLPLQFQKE